MAVVIGAIREKWLQLGGEGFSGAPLTVERPTFDGVGRAQHFAHGVVISWHPSLGAFAVWGLINAKWQALGAEQFGYPGTDELGCPDGRGRFNHFRAMQHAGGPPSSIYWTPSTGAHEVHGAIRAAWKDQGFERGSLGYPTSDEFSTSGPGRRSDFEHGFISWTPTGGARVRSRAIDDGPELHPV